MLVKVFDIKKSDIFNHWVAEYHNVKEVKAVGLNVEIILSDNSKIGYRTDLYGVYVEA